MFLKIEKPLIIDNLNGYPSEVVAQLQSLLARGVEARLDPARKKFYQIDHPDRAFFIHACPAAGKVMLLASWPAQMAVPANAS